MEKDLRQQCKRSLFVLSFSYLTSSKTSGVLFMFSFQNWTVRAGFFLLAFELIWEIHSKLPWFCFCKRCFYFYSFVTFFICFVSFFIKELWLFSRFYSLLRYFAFAPYNRSRKMSLYQEIGMRNLASSKKWLSCAVSDRTRSAIALNIDNVNRIYFYCYHDNTLRYFLNFAFFFPYLFSDDACRAGVIIGT